MKRTTLSDQNRQSFLIAIGHLSLNYMVSHPPHFFLHGGLLDLGFGFGLALALALGGDLLFRAFDLLTVLAEALLSILELLSNGAHGEHGDGKSDEIDEGANQAPGGREVEG